MFIGLNQTCGGNFKFERYRQEYLRSTNRPTLYKAELLLLKLIHLFAIEVLLVKKFEIKETK